MKKAVMGLGMVSMLFTSCRTTNPYTGDPQNARATTGAVIGGLVGLGLGSLTGDGSTESRQRAMLGAGIGALAGGGLGNYMDRQEAELRNELQGTGVGIRRQGSEISLVMPGDVTFATGSSTIDGGFYSTLNSVARVLSKYDRTMVNVTGHTDNVGGVNYNYRLSQDRANSVAGFLNSRRVNPSRLRVSGVGPDQPIASNHSSSGRQANRRVAIELAPY